MENMENTISDKTSEEKRAMWKKWDESNKGLTICVISRGNIPTIWMKHMVERITKAIPSGCYWNWVFNIGTPEINGKNYATLRTECIEECIRRGSRWAFFVDDDVFVPDFTIQKFLSLSQKGLKVISGLYYKKNENVEPVIFKELGNGPYFNFPTNSVFEIEGSGAGCMWIDLGIFKEFDKRGLPYFKQDWLMALDKEGKNQVQVEIGEDHWLYYNAKNLGVQPYCDSSICCDHYDSKANKMYPIETEVSRIKGLDLRNKDSCKDSIKKFVEAKKPNIMFVVPSAVPFNGKTLEERGIGGSETAIIHTAKGLANDNNVVVFCTCPQQGETDGVLYLDLSMLEIMNSIPIELMVMYRINNPDYVKGMKDKYKPKHVVYWTQDYPMYAGFDANFLKIPPLVDYMVCVSNDHKEALCERYPCMLDEDKILVIEDGVDNNLYKDKDKIEKKKNQFYYSSTPYRGLEILLEVFPKIKEKVPDATLKVCSSMLVYSDVVGDKQYEQMYKKCKETPGVQYLGSMKQSELARVAMESYLMLYPSIYAETCCISVEEAQTAGTPVVCNNLGALKETVHTGCGIIIPGNPRKEEWQNEFVRTIVDLCNGTMPYIEGDKQPTWEAIHQECLKQDFDWSKSVEKWKKLVQNFTGEPSTKMVQ